VTDDELLAAAHEHGYPYGDPELNALMEGMMEAKAIHDGISIGEVIEQYPEVEGFVMVCLRVGVPIPALVGAIETGLALIHAQGNGFDALGPRIQAMLDEDPLLTVAKTMIHSADLFDLSKVPEKAAEGMSTDRQIEVATRTALGMAMAIMHQAMELRRR